VNDDYQNNHNIYTKNASKTFAINDKYHDEKNSKMQKFNKNFVNYESFEYFANISIKQIKIYACKRCQSKFYFNNKFHKHVRECRKTIKIHSFSNEKTISNNVHVQQIDV
jgi:ribosome biogenesis protein Nip4